MGKTDWKSFEIAVAAFIAALDPAAKILHDVKTPDKHTGVLRQRDVWVQTVFGGFFPIKIHVSCKCWSTPLNQQDIDAFNGELLSSGAHKGVIYSFSGFTEGAISKSKALGISCCSLFEYTTPPIPEVLEFEAWNFRECIKFAMMGDLTSTEVTVDDLLSCRLDDGDKVSCFDMLVRNNDYTRTKALQKINNMILPTWCTWVFSHHPKLSGPIRLILEGGWKAYKARFDAWLVNGSYSFTENIFKGNAVTPAIDIKGYEPGPGWDHVGYNVFPQRPNVLSTILYKGQIVEEIRSAFGSMTLLEFCRNSITV